MALGNGGGVLTKPRECEFRGEGCADKVAAPAAETGPSTRKVASPRRSLRVRLAQAPSYVEIDRNDAAGPATRARGETSAAQRVRDGALSAIPPAERALG